MSVVYKATNKINGKGYIGYTNQPFEKRKYQHLWEAKGKTRRFNQPFFAAIRKYGEDNFEWEILKTDATLEDEIHLIQEHKTNVDQWGYNVNPGGIGRSGYVTSEETKRKQSEAHKKIPRTQTQLANLNRKGCLDKERLALMTEKARQANLGRKHSEASKEKMRQRARARHQKDLKWLLME